jgi:hypothetical protein
MELSSSEKAVSCAAEWTPFQTHCFSENLVAPGIETGPLDLQPGTLTTRPQRRSILFYITYINSLPLVILHHLLNVFVQLANKRGFTKKKKKKVRTSQETQYIFDL